MVLVTVTWSFETSFDINNTFLYRSYIKNNDPKHFHHHHFDRNKYIEEEKEFEKNFGYQFDYILYKIVLLEDLIEGLDSDYVLFADATDTVCLKDLNTINPQKDLLFSSELNMYPWSRGGWNVPEYSENIYLNSGLILAKKTTYLELIKSVKENIIPLNFDSFGGDQGIYTYHYLAQNSPKIELDTSNEIFLSTFSRDISHFKKENLPYLVHDNGWNWGSPRFITNFSLV